MMKIKRVIFASSLLLLTLPAFTQSDRLGIWYGADASLKLFRDVKAEMAGSVRTDENGSDIESFYVEGGLNYKLNKYLNLGAYYRIIEKKEDDGNFYFRHRVSAGLKGKLPVYRFTLSAAYRFQEQTRTYIKDPSDEDPGFYNRFKLGLDYNVRGLPLTPSVYTELLGETLASNGILFEKRRTGVDLTYRIRKKQDVSVGYIYMTSRVSNPEYFNVITLNYSVKF